jgi:hypothetical protein
MSKFNRERRVIDVLRSGRAVLVLGNTWDSPGVLAANRPFADALEHPARMRWDADPLDRVHARDDILLERQPWLSSERLSGQPK